MEAKESFKVNIKSLDDRKMEYNLSRGTSIAEFKAKISESTSLPIDQIRLIYQAKNLHDSQKIEEIVQSDGEVFHLIAKLNPTPPPREEPRPQQAPPLNLNALLGNISSMFGGLQPQGGQQGGGYVSMNMGSNAGTDPQQTQQQQQMPDLNNTFAQMMQQVNSMVGNPQGTFQNTGNNQQNNEQRQEGEDMNIRPGNPQEQPQSQPQPQQQPRPQAQAQPQQGQNTGSNMPGARETTFMPNTPRANNIVSVNNQGINISISQQNAEAKNFVLNTEKLRALKEVNERLRNNDIDIPRRQEPNNSATILGNYIKTTNMSLYNFLPTLDRASEILEAEQRMTDATQRARATEYIQSMGNTFKTYREIFESLEFLSQFNFNDRPGRFSIGALDTSNRRTDTNDESRVQRDRTNINNMMNMLSGGVSAHQSLGELSRMAGANDIDEEDMGSDCVNLLFEPLNITDFMQLMAGNIGVIDANHPKIKKNYQKMLIKHDNSREAVKKVLLDDMTDEILVMIKNKGEGHSDPNFDYEYILKEINNKYMDEFGNLLLKDYENVTEHDERFSTKYISLLKRYLGHIAFELSQTMPNGIEDFRYILKEGFIEYINKRMEMPGFDLGSLFDNLVWKHVHEGYVTYQTDHKEIGERNLLLSRLKDFREIDESVEPETEHSEAYMKGKIFE